MYNFDNPAFVELVANKEFVVKMLSQETPEDVQKLFAENGIELTLDDVRVFGEALAEAENKDELSAADLENVAGGVIAAATVWGIIKVGSAAVAAGLAIYKWYKSR